MKKRAIEVLDELKPFVAVALILLVPGYVPFLFSFVVGAGLILIALEMSLVAAISAFDSGYIRKRLEGYEEISFKKYLWKVCRSVLVSSIYLFSGHWWLATGCLATLLMESSLWDLSRKIKETGPPEYWDSAKLP